MFRCSKQHSVYQTPAAEAVLWLECVNLSGLAVGQQPGPQGAPDGVVYGPGPGPNSDWQDEAVIYK
jgi:hypothetical protein